MPSAAARAATAFARLPVEEQASVVAPALERLRAGDRDDPVLERVCGVRRVELEVERPHAERGREPRSLNERREPRCQPLLGGRGDRQERRVAPERRRACLDRLATELSPKRLLVVYGLERPEAARADPDRARAGTRARTRGTEGIGSRWLRLTRRPPPSRSTHPPGIGTVLVEAGCRGVAGPVPQPLSMRSEACLASGGQYTN